MQKNNSDNTKLGNIHEFHRQRMRQRYIEEGPFAFADHELLEMLLYYCYTRRNTNDIAHKFINAFGGFNNLLNASPKEITARTKTSESVAVLISIVMEIHKRYLKNSIDEKIDISSPEICASYLKQYFTGKKHEMFIAFSLDSNNKLINKSIYEDGASSSIAMNPQQIVKSAILDNASKIIISHNHPSGNIMPTTNDIYSTKKIFTSLKLVDISLIDHIIFTDKRYYSFAENHLLTGLEDFDI